MLNYNELPLVKGSIIKKKKQEGGKKRKKKKRKKRAFFLYCDFFALGWSLVMHKKVVKGEPDVE
jgi:hypothetical protein